MPCKASAPRQTLFRVARAFAIAYLLVLLLMLLLEESLIFFPTRYPEPEGFWNPPGLKFEDAWFTSEDGVKLHGWFVPHERPRGVLLFSHGNAGNIAVRDDRLRNLHDQFDLAVMIYDYRGYGRSQGKPSEAGILKDARAARLWLAKRAGVNEADILLYGESLGGGVAVDLAATDGARGLILESTFTSLPDMASYHYPWLPARWFMRSRLDSLSKIKQYHGPLLWSHGSADEIVPYQIGRRLFDAANDPKRGITIEGGRHNGPPFPEDNPAYARALDEFLTSLDPPTANIDAAPAR